MHINGWKDSFAPWILTRGRDYWRDGLVENLRCTQEKITADVDGTAPYQVEIVLENGSVEDMSCTCPYAEDGENCKHMAAVLFTASPLPETELPATPTARSSDG